MGKEEEYALPYLNEQKRNFIHNTHPVYKGMTKLTIKVLKQYVKSAQNVRQILLQRCW